MYRISNTHNLLVVIGCNTLGYIESQKNSDGLYPYDYYTGCMSYCNDLYSIIDGSCSGVGCCQVTIPSGLSDNLITFSDYSHTGLLSFSRCDYAFLVDKDWFKFGKSNLTMSTKKSVPVWLNWALTENYNCVEAQKSPELYGCRSGNGKCYDSVNGPGYLCKCLEGYHGNPYIVNGCADINECELPDEYPCHGICYNKEGSYDCKCELGKHGNPFNNSCTDNFTLRERLAIGISAGTVILFVILSVIFMYQKRKLQRELQERDTFAKELQSERETLFKRNTGLILYEQLAIRKVETMNFFTEEELEKITENFSTVIGRGAQGIVYKGRLEGTFICRGAQGTVIGRGTQGTVISRAVAVKKCTAVDNEKMKEGFVNELIILSQINHKNVVRLVGCCLELDVSTLVYEYIPQGTLSSFLHRNQSDISLEIRLKICIDSAKALDHLHSETVQPILHGDVKSTNILLDNNYMAKVSDFGISRFLSMDMTQVTNYPRGTYGYLDPEFLQNGCLTTKSDVYSFGVVVLELITRKKSVYLAENNESKSLVHEFLKAVRENKAEELFDQDIATKENLGLLVKVAKIAEKCLRPTGEERPTMTEVAEQLKGLMTELQAMRDVPTEFYTVSQGPDSDTATLLK